MSLSFLAEAQDTIVGWTFPSGSKNSIANLGNELNKGGMFIEAAKIDELPFSAIYFSSDGYLTNSAASINWDSAKDMKCWKFSCDATGYKNLIFSARISSDSSQPGPRDFKMQYRLGCCSPIWHDIPDVQPFTVSTDWTTGYLNNIKLPADADSMAGLQVRFVCISDTATDGSILKPSSKSFIDEVYVFGTSMTSIYNPDKKFQIEMYPNPASDFMHIESPYMINSYKIRDLSGKLVKSGIINKADYLLNCPSLPKGYYIIEFSFYDNYRYTEKIIIR